VKMLTAKQVARLLRVHTNTVYRWMKEDKTFPVVRHGRQVRVPEELLEKWIKGRAGSEA